MSRCCIAPVCWRFYFSVTIVNRWSSPSCQDTQNIIFYLFWRHRLYLVFYLRLFIFSRQPLISSCKDPAGEREFTNSSPQETYECIWRERMIFIRNCLCPAVFFPRSRAKICRCSGASVYAPATKCWCEVSTPSLLLLNLQRTPLYLVQWPSLVRFSVISLNLRKTPSAKSMRHYWVCASSNRLAQRKALHNWIVIEY